MFKKNSIFIKVFIPVIIVMLLQTGAISLVLHVNGTIDSLGNAALESLAKNTENRSTNLERMMIYYWSNLYRLKMSMTEEIKAYLEEHNITIYDVWGDCEHEINILKNLSEAIIQTLRISGSTGVFVYFLSSEGFKEQAQTLNGLYYRNFDPFTNPIDNSDLLFLRGFIDIARKDNIPLDNLWRETFLFDPQHEDLWRGFSYPQIAAMEFPGASPVDLAYWNRPHHQNPWSRADTGRSITYTKPFFFEGSLIAMIGSEVQLTHLERYFPASDFDIHSQSGYMLIQFDAGDDENERHRCAILTMTGGFINRLVGSRDEIMLEPTSRIGVFTTAPGELAEGVRVVRSAMRLYNNNAPFADEVWALAAMSTDFTLFESGRIVAGGIFASSVVAFILGGGLLVFTIRKSTKPLISIAAQIADTGSGGSKTFISDSKTYEIALLCSTLNSMEERRSLAEAQVREERQRYLIALESATDTFMEYDVAQDTFMLYYFSEGGPGGGRSAPESKTISRFTEAVRLGEFCHPDDGRKLTEFMYSAETETIEIRSKTSVFSHISGVEADDGYYWFLIKASRIYSDGKLSKIIGAAKEITGEKLAEYARNEAVRRDPTTGFYNCEYGVRLIGKNTEAAAGQGKRFSQIIICINGFDELESFYGRVFGGFVLREFSRAMSAVINAEEGDVAVRLSNDEFMIFFNEADDGRIRLITKQIEDLVQNLYTGEKKDLGLSAKIITAGAAGADKSIDGGGVLRNKPISIFLDVNSANIVSSAFELFERTSDVHSAIRVLLGVLGEMFSLRRIVIFSLDASFGATQVSYQWGKEGAVPCRGNIEKISHDDLADFEAALDENGTLLYNDKTAADYGEGVAGLLCPVPGESVNAYCCVMYDNAVHTGRTLFIADDTDKVWTEAEKRDLYDIVKIISANIDIDKSRSASRAKSEFLSRISHEIRTPMNAIIGMTDIAINSTHNHGRLTDSLKKIDFSAKHLLNLINDVLEMSRIECGKMELENAPFSLSGFVSDIETLMRIPIESRQMTFNINVACRHDYVTGDQYRLRQVIVNLLGNANKFTDPGGVITFSVEELYEEAADAPAPDGGEYGYFRFSIKDTGVGISLKDQPLLFKAFGQVGSGASEGKKQGTGLGLAISGNIISAMGGKIELNSETNKGSEFYFSLKLKLRDAETGSLTETEGETSPDIDYTGQFAGKRVLLVDDIDINIEIASFILEASGVEIDVAVNGQEAVDKFFASDAGYYNAILMDIQMPVMDGLTAAKKIRKDARRPDARTVPIIAMTANAFDEDMKKSVESGMNGHVAKPIESEKLLALLERFL